MTRAEAKRRVCAAFATHMDNDGENAWLTEARDGGELSDADQRRMKDAFDDLVAELRRRGGALERTRCARLENAATTEQDTDR